MRNRLKEKGQLESQDQRVDKMKTRTIGDIGGKVGSLRPSSAKKATEYNPAAPAVYRALLCEGQGSTRNSWPSLSVTSFISQISQSKHPPLATQSSYSTLEHPPCLPDLSRQPELVCGPGHMGPGVVKSRKLLGRIK